MTLVFETCLSENFNQSRLEISMCNLFHETHPKVFCKIMKLTMQILMNTLGQTKQSLVLRVPLPESTNQGIPDAKKVQTTKPDKWDICLSLLAVFLGRMKKR